MRGARPLTPREIERVREVLDDRDRGLFEVLLNLGLRLSEALELNVGDVVDVRGDVVDELRVRPMKTGRGRRVPLNSSVRAVLRELVDGRGNHEEPLFVSRHGRRLSRTQASRLFMRLRDELGLGSRVSSHSCRKSTATLLRRRGVGLDVIRSILGHRDLASLAAYIDVDPDDVVQAVHSLDDL